MGRLRGGGRSARHLSHSHAPMPCRKKQDGFKIVDPCAIASEAYFYYSCLLASPAEELRSQDGDLSEGLTFEHAHWETTPAHDGEGLRQGCCPNDISVDPRRRHASAARQMGRLRLRSHGRGSFHRDARRVGRRHMALEPHSIGPRPNAHRICTACPSGQDLTFIGTSVHMPTEQERHGHRPQRTKSPRSQRWSCTGRAIVSKCWEVL